jgi:glycosyltransferase involved in cell wall biosynthesis
MLSKALVVGAYQAKLEEMARQPGIELTVVVPPYWQEGRQRLTLERSHTSGYELFVEPMALNGHFHAHFYPGLAAIVRRLCPDIFHIDEEPYNLATFQATWLGRSVGARCLFFTWQNLYRPQPWNVFERYTLSHCHAAIAGNQEAAAILRRKGFPGPTTVIPQFGVDPAMFSPITRSQDGQRQRLFSSVSPNTFMIGYVGRLVEQKGLHVLLRAVVRLTGDWQLVFLGDGPLRPELEQAVRDFGLTQRVSFVPAVPSGMVPVWLNALDCLALPSLTRPNWKEQFGRVLVEAMACEVPVVGSDSGEIPNVIGDAGLIAHEGNDAALYRQLDRLMKDVALRRRLGQAGRQRVLANYTQASIAAATCAFYRQVL